MKKIVRRAVSLGFQTYEDTLEFEYDETKEGSEFYVTKTVEDFENEVLEKGLEWYNRIKNTDEFKESQQAKQNKGGYSKPDWKSSAKQQSGNNYNKPNPYKPQGQPQSSGGTIQDPQGRQLNLNGSEQANDLVRRKLFGHGKQWDFLIKKQVDVENINSYQQLQSHF